MYDISSFITRLNTNWTNPVASLDQGQELSLQSREASPVFLFSYRAVTPDDHVLGDGIAPDNFNAFRDNFRQILEIKINCSIVNFPVIWKEYKAFLENWNPIDTEQEYSSLFYLGGQRQGIANGRMTWIDNWGIDFPRVTVRY